MSENLNSFQVILKRMIADYDLLMSEATGGKHNPAMKFRLADLATSLKNIAVLSGVKPQEWQNPAEQQAFGNAMVGVVQIEKRT
jgi:hypothetical protein